MVPRAVVQKKPKRIGETPVQTGSKQSTEPSAVYSVVQKGHKQTMELPVVVVGSALELGVVFL